MWSRWTRVYIALLAVLMLFSVPTIVYGMKYVFYIEKTIGVAVSDVTIYSIYVTDDSIYITSTYDGSGFLSRLARASCRKKACYPFLTTAIVSSSLLLASSINDIFLRPRILSSLLSTSNPFLRALP